MHTVYSNCTSGQVPRTAPAGTMGAILSAAAKQDMHIYIRLGGLEGWKAMAVVTRTDAVSLCSRPLMFDVHNPVAGTPSSGAAICLHMTYLVTGRACEGVKDSAFSRAISRSHRFSAY